MRKGIGPRGLGAAKSPLKQAASSREITEGSFGKSSKNAKDTSGDPRISGHNERLKSGMVEKDNRPPVVEDKSIASFNGKRHYTVTGEAQRPNTSSRQDNTSPAKQTSTTEKFFDFASKVVGVSPVVQAGKAVYDHFTGGSGGTTTETTRTLEESQSAERARLSRERGVGRQRTGTGMGQSMTRNVSRMDEPMTNLPRKKASVPLSGGSTKLQPTNVTKPAAKPTKKQARKNKRADKLEAKASKLRS